MIGLARSSLQYRPAIRDDDALRLALVQLARQYGRYGYRKIAKLLRIEGWRVRHKKVERIWREEGLQLPQRHKRRKRLYQKDGSIIRLRPIHPNHVWSIDLVQDKLSNGRRYKMLVVLDEFTRQALAVEVRSTMTSDHVLEVLYRLFLRHGKPKYVRSDNGPEFASEAMQTWLERVGVKPLRIYPGSPWENGQNERFNGTLRREVLDAEWFTTTRQAQVVIDLWLKQYNHTRPHQALNMRPPVPETLARNGPVVGGSTELPASRVRMANKTCPTRGCAAATRKRRLAWQLDRLEQFFGQRLLHLRGPHHSNVDGCSHPPREGQCMNSQPVPTGRACLPDAAIETPCVEPEWNHGLQPQTFSPALKQQKGREGPFVSVL